MLNKTNDRFRYLRLSRKKPFERRALLCFEEKSYLQGCLATVRILEIRGSFRMSGNVW